MFGLTSFGNALTGGSQMGIALMAVSPVGYFVQAVIGRVLMGVCCGLVYRAVRKLTRGGMAAYAAGAVSAPLLNTTFYMGFMCLLFFGSEYVQNMANGANPLMFIVAAVGIQGVVEILVCGVLGCIISRAVDAALGRRAAAVDTPAQERNIAR